ncbi:GNAT family protein [Vibrio sp. SCSIO 43136]|uniref:GNAT family N-acetyltransferase n=1 Tax=Vibrio sp. SCSIO 43136 TaxID=2819101 RepID=UPI00207618F2|nr:GNAT family protein [Vibrio sp. SCSIO 43136]USD66200.1 GNAT family N-acetyltransferase [Vibrio sp. SCSIO 43136]
MHSPHTTQLHTHRLTLRLIETCDCEALSKLIVRSKSLHQWLDWADPSFTAEDAEDFILSNRINWLKGQAFGFGVFLQDSDELIGMVAITEYSRTFNLGTLGYWVGDEYQGRGLVKEALHALIEHSFSSLKITRLEIICDPSNHISQKVASGVGACFETKARNRFIYAGEARDGLVYSLVPSREE